MFITNKDVTERDMRGDEDKIKQFLKDIGNIGYKQRGDTKSNRSKLIKKMHASIGEAVWHATDSVRSRIGEFTSQVISIPTSNMIMNKRKKLIMR